MSYGMPVEATEEDDDNIRVFVRVRPESDVEGYSCLTVDSASRRVVVQCKPEPKAFTFDAVADASFTQEAVFSSVARGLIESCIAGYNATIFAYGQTGSGKTFTMLGPSEDDVQNFQHELRGIVPRSFEHLFNLVARELEMSGKNLEFLCKCSFLEIYNEQVFDLLDASSTGLHLRENMKLGVFVEGLTEMAVTNASEAYQVLVNGWQNRTVASTAMNRESSRSHAVFTVQVESKETKNGLQNIRQGALNLVDLAGSERQRDTRAAGQRLKEAGSINKSLSALGNVIMALVDVMNGKSRHVPYRDSKLTFLLRDSLGGNAKTCMVACIHPGIKCLGETLSTLQYARRAKLIRNKAVVNEDTHGNVVALQAEIRKLKEELTQWQQQQQSGGLPPAAALLGPCDALRTDESHLLNGHSDPLPDHLPSASAAARSKAVAAAARGKAVAAAAAGSQDWKLCFFDAMLLLEQAENEKQELEHRAAAAEDVCTKQDKFLQSTKMIIKFRENCIRRLEAEQGSQEHDAVVAELQKEVDLLRSQLELNPALAKCAAENKSLRGELQRLLTSAPMADARDLTSRRRTELEALYGRLTPRLAATAAAARSFAGAHVSPTAGGEGETDVVGCSKCRESSVAHEKYRDQAQSLQAANELIKQEAAAERERAARCQAELECELAALRQSYGDLERLLAARQLQSRLDRDIAGEVQMQTLLNIATPTRSPCVVAALRAAATAAASSASPMLPPLPSFEDALNDTTSSAAATSGCATDRADTLADSDDRNNEALDAAAEAAAEALAEQIKRLQVANDELQERLDVAESDAVKCQQQITRLDHLGQSLQEQYDVKNRELDDAAKRAAQLASALAAKTSDAEFLKSKVDDLTIMLDYSDRQIKELKTVRVESERSSARLLESLQAQLVKLRCELESLQTEHSTLSLEKAGLQEALDAIQAARAVDEDRLHNAEGSLAIEKGRISRLEAELQETLASLDAERRRNSALLSQAQDEKARELAEAVEQCAQIGTECDRLRVELHEAAVRLDRERRAADELRCESSSLTKELSLHKESSARLTVRLQELRAVATQHEQRAAALARELTEKTEQLAASLTLAEDRSCAVDELRKQLDSLARSAELRNKKFEVEMAMMKDEYDTVSSECQRLGAELASANEALLKAKATIEEKGTVISTMQAEVEKRARELDDMRAERAPQPTIIGHVPAVSALSCTPTDAAPTPLPHQRLVAVLASASASGGGSGQRSMFRSPGSSRGSELSGTVAALERDSESYQRGRQQAALSRLLADLERGREEKARELAELKARLSEREAAEADRAARLTSLESELFLLRQEVEMRRSEVSLNAKEAAAARLALQALEKSKDEALAEKYAALSELTSLQMKCEAVLAEKQELESAVERLKEIAHRDHRELTRLQSELQMSEEKLARETDTAGCLRDELVRLEKQNAALVGHHNIKQKIQYHVQLKEENIRLKEENSRLKEAAGCRA